MINKNEAGDNENNYDMYTVMKDDILYKEVRDYLRELNVSSKVVDISLLNKKFGDGNIKRLVKKSYLIKFGKGVTTGR